MVKMRKYLHQKVLWGLNERVQRGIESASTQCSAHRKLNNAGWQHYQWNPEEGEAWHEQRQLQSFKKRQVSSLIWKDKDFFYWTERWGHTKSFKSPLLYELPLPHRCSPCFSIKCRIIPVRINYWAASLCPSIVHFSFLSTQPGPRWISPQKGVQ